MTKIIELAKKFDLVRLMFLIGAMAMLAETIWISSLLVDNEKFHWLVLLPIVATLVFLYMTVFYHTKLAKGLLNIMGYIGQMLLPAYLLLSGCAMWLMSTGWNGCIVPNESWEVCYYRLTFVWTYFPITSPFVDLNFLWGRGFGGGYELTYVVTTALITLGLIGILFVTDFQYMTWTSILMISGVLIAAMECAFYCYFTVIYSNNSWPGAFISAFVLVALLMLDWRIKKANSSEIE